MNASIVVMLDQAGHEVGSCNPSYLAGSIAADQLLVADEQLHAARAADQWVLEETAWASVYFWHKVTELIEQEAMS